MHAFDGQTDGRTDGILIARPRLHSMQRGNNYNMEVVLTYYTELIRVYRRSITR